MHRISIRQKAPLLGALLLAVAAVFILSVSRPGAPVSIGAVRANPLNVTLTIATLNLWHDYPHYSLQQERLETAQLLLQELSPDLLCLQEASRTPVVDSAAEALATGLNMQGVVARANGNRNLIRFEEGEAVLTRGALRDTAAGELRPRAGFFEHRLALWATVETVAGPVVVFSTHLTNQGGAVNAAQMGSLVDLVERQRRGLPAVVAGDFNAQEDTSQMRALPEHWRDAFREAQPEASGATSPDSGRRIDYIFLVDGDSVRWKILEAGVFGANGVILSDHLGVWTQASLVPER
ncbi:MAG: endonuclease/exonuclease/phosphatase family protein [Anaerolineae bacterium]|jgi:endonuclease/exonuclease/phosphatase family metal-dependent hydrolase|nr:endonuclease/exonuclease/phosphatase family protein [Anaerolineae bacterium]